MSIHLLGNFTQKMFSKSIDNILFLTPTDPFEIPSLCVSHRVALSQHPYILWPHSDCLWVETSTPAMGVGLSEDTWKCIQVFLASSFIDKRRQPFKRQWFSLKGLGKQFSVLFILNSTCPFQATGFLRTSLLGYEWVSPPTPLALFMALESPSSGLFMLILI